MGDLTGSILALLVWFREVRLCPWKYIWTHKRHDLRLQLVPTIHKGHPFHRPSCGM